MNRNNLPGIVITGASGFIGRHVVESLRETFHVFALARRTQQEVGVPRHQNIEWILVDIGDALQLDRVFRVGLAWCVLVFLPILCHPNQLAGLEAIFLCELNQLIKGRGLQNGCSG